MFGDNGQDQTNDDSNQNSPAGDASPAPALSSFTMGPAPGVTPVTEENNNEPTSAPPPSDDSSGLSDESPSSAPAPAEPAMNDTPSDDNTPNDNPPDADEPKPAEENSDLMDIKKQALSQLTPIVSHLDQTPEEKFKTLLMMIQASDDQSLIKNAHEVAQQITDEKAKAQALLDIVNEINYFTQSSKN